MSRGNSIDPRNTEQRYISISLSHAPMNVPMRNALFRVRNRVIGIDVTILVRKQSRNANIRVSIDELSDEKVDQCSH